MRRAVCTVVLFVVGVAGATVAAAQSVTIPPLSPAEQSTPATKESTAEEAVATGFVANMRLDLSNSSQGAFVQLIPRIGYGFKTWGVDFGVPLASSNASSTATGAASHSGVGDLYLRVYYEIAPDRVNFTSTVTGTVPTGDSTIGLGTGQTTWDWTNHVDHDFRWITPFLDVGVGNSLNSATGVNIRLGGARAGRPPRTMTIPTQPYTTIGKLAHVDAGIDVDVSGALSFSVLAYDTMPWGNQTAVSRFLPLTKPSTQSTPSGQRNQNTILRSTKGQRFFEVNAVTQGTASLTRDNGFGASVGIKPTRYLDVSVNYSHSVPLKLDVVSVSVSTNLTSLFRKAGS